MKQAASSSSSSPPKSGPGRLGRRGGRRRPPPQPGKLQKLGLAVREFVGAAAAASENSGRFSAFEAPQKQRGRNRRELRREKRKWKRAQRRRRCLPKEEEAPISAVKAPRPPLAPQQPKERPAPPEGPAQRGEKKKQRPSSSASAALARKRALLAANEAEEREIRRLERQLGLSRRRKQGKPREASALPQSFARDGLGYVLGALEPGASAFYGLEESSEEEEGEEKEMEEEEGREGREWEERLGLTEEGEEETEEEERREGKEWEEGPSGKGGGEQEDWSMEEGGLNVEGEAEDEDPSSGFITPEGLAKEPASPKEGESLSQSATKYVPPQMRRSGETLDAKKREELERLKKTLKGLINRLSEPNLASISGQLEELYMANSRKDMNETLTDVLISACVMPSAMPSRLVMEHVLLISILHQTVGIEVGAHFLETVVRKFDEVYKSETEGKECENLITLTAHLYNFYVVHSVLIFDILKKLVSTFSEKDIELILLLLKNVGFSLRKDDALALKELITEAQKKANVVGKQFQDQSRVRFMLEIMLALKNNDMRKIPGYDPEPVEKLRKLQRTLIHNMSGKEAQLRVSLECLLSADQVGRWWIVGSSWSGAPMIDSPSDKVQQMLPIGKVSSKILELARKQRMNTDIRRNIFCILMTSEDFLDAFEKLLKFRLKDQQEREIVHVLIDCCLQEKTYNPFYAYLSAKFCEYERRFQMTFQFSMWDKIRDLGNLSPTTFFNLVNLLVHLLKTKSLSLTIFKVIEFSELDKPKVHFLRHVLSALLLKTDPEDLNHIFGKLSDNPKMGMLHESLKLFLTHFLLKNIHAHKSPEEASLLKERIEIVTKALKAKESRLKL
ncbi:nucleolar MIF4G domain-containing protein 1 [Sceloporus undulatus]|uniref:nucleolar MIF4G domain-containing protein 1 n=1 Tax=Sceloporus undulatus TaxID=8520 RepID=UPI001C4DD5DA|nr:nucleolar MIF4G domain-containing protein 1 [Sceloporus undulatus]